MNRAQVYVHKCLVSFEMCYGVQETITGLADMTQNKKPCSLLRKQLETNEDAAGIAMAIESPPSVCHLLHLPQIHLVQLFFLQCLQVEFSSVSVASHYRIKQGLLQARKKYVELLLKGIKWESSAGKSTLLKRGQRQKSNLLLGSRRADVSQELFSSSDANQELPSLLSTLFSF